MTRLLEAVAELNEEQREAVGHLHDTVVLAGPGSGKTDTVVLKVATLLAREIRPPRGVACITFSTDAAREFTTRLRRYGVRPDRRLFLGTVHGFCLTKILRPFARLAGEPGLASRAVLTAQRQRGLIGRALDLEGVGEDPRYFDTTLATIRKAIACDEDLAPFDDRHVLVARRFESLLCEQDVIDFDAMTFEALRLIRSVPAVGDLLVARYPWLAVDEYQDLGGPLHNIVLELRAVGARVFAVGDPDQCVYGFTGANPRYLHDLTEDQEFHTVRLRFNYRSGQQLIDAAEGALGVKRDYRADPDRTDDGQVAFKRCDDGLEAQAEVVASEIVPSLLAAGLPAHEIALLYPRKGSLLTLMLGHLQSAGIPFLWEKDISFSDQPVIKWLQRCAAWALNPGSSDVDTFADIVAPYLWMMEAGKASNDYRGLAGRARLFAALDGAVTVQSDLGPWLRRVARDVDLLALLNADAARPDEVDAFETLLGRLLEEPATLGDFARGAQVNNHVLVTTYHSSKGRQFDAVILPGLQETLVPNSRWNARTRSYLETNLAEDRRLFYVALTRARRQAVLCYSPSFFNDYGYGIEGHSRFVDEVAQRLGMDAG